MPFASLRSPVTPARRLRVLALGAALLLAGCGGGVYWSIGDDDEPDVDLAASPDLVSSGDTFELQASAGGGSGFIDEVRFYRVDDDALVFLGADTESPYRLTVTAPTVTSTTTRQYVARAWDEFGNRGESDEITVTVQP